MLAKFLLDPLNRALFASLIGLFALIVVVLIYIIKSKYVPKTVSSTFIWKRSLKYMKRRVPINFIMSFLLIVQIFVVIIAALSLADIHTKPSKSEATIVIVDASASMNAKVPDSDGKTRYELALEKIRAEAQEVDENSAMSIILACEYPEILTKTTIKDEKNNTEEEYHYVYTRDEAVEIVDKQLPGRCTNIETDINAALDLAKTAVRQNKEAKIYLYTDRMYAYNDTVTIVNCSDPEKDWNAGITTFTDTLLAAGYEYTANIINDGKEAEFVVSLTVDGQVLATKKITMGKGETRRITFSPKSSENTDAVKIKGIKKYEKAKIEINTVDDVISDDNIAYLAAVPQADLRVLYVSSNLKSNGSVLDYTYQTQLQLSLGANGIVIESSDIYHASQVKSAPTTGYDLYIYEGVMPVSMPEDGAVWFLNAPSSPVGTNITFSDVVKDASKDGSGGYNLEKSDVILGTIGQQLTTNVNFDDPVKLVINGELKVIPAVVSKMSVIGKVDSATGEVELVIPENFEAVYSCSYNIKLTNNEVVQVKTPVVLAGKVGTVRTIVTTFDFTNSSLPLFISDYPVFVKNLIEYSTPDILPERTPTIGDTLQFNAPAGVESITYYYKSYDTQIEEDKSGKATNGKEINKWSASESVEPPTIVLDELGIYNVVVKYKPQIKIDEDGGTIENAAETDTFAVSTYMPLSESDITARGPKLSAPSPDKDARTDIRGRSILWVFVLVFIIIVIIEWGVYYRDEY